MNAIALENKDSALAQVKAREAKNNELLEQAIKDASIESGIEISDTMLSETKKRFSYSNGKVHATSIFREIPDYLKNHQRRIEKAMIDNDKTALTLQDRLDIQAKEKHNAFEEMIYWSRSGNVDMAQYKKARARYMSL